MIPFFKKSGAAFFLVLLFSTPASAGTLSCSVTTHCAAGTVVFKLSDTENAHAELPGQSNYRTLVCCTGVVELGTACSGTYATVLKLSQPTNAHVEQNDRAAFPESVCLSVPDGGSASVGYQTMNCDGFDTALASISGPTNAHVGAPGVYPTKLCASATGGPQTLTFSLSDNTIGFGTLSPTGARYATGDLNGRTSEVEAHTLTVSTNAPDGYDLFVTGSTLSYDGYTIAALGGSNTPSIPGNEQFGLRLQASGGNGAVVPPYESSGFALDTGAFPDLIAQDRDGDDVPTTYSVRYLANVAIGTEAGTYSASLNYLIVGKF